MKSNSERCYGVGEHRFGKDGLQRCHYVGCIGDAVLDAIRWEEIRESRSEYPDRPERGTVYGLYD